MVSKIKRQVFHDIKLGIGMEWRYYILFCLALVLFLMINQNQSIFGNENDGATWGDFFGYFFLGIEKSKGLVDQTTGFHLPFEWFFLQTYVLYSAIKYPKQNYEECGYQVLIRTRSKSNWWISKTIWCLLHVSIYYILFYLITFLFCSGFGGNVDWHMSSGRGLRLDQVSELKLAFILFVMPFIISSSLCLLSITLSFCKNSIFALIIDLIILISSVYWKNDYLIGNYSMLYRYYSVKFRDTMEIKKGLIICGLLALISIIVGLILFNKKEWNGRRNSDVC